jgi:dTDP-glucose 4,6-dehydratase
MRLLVTGGSGFIGCNFIRLMLKEHSDWQIANLDKLTYAGRAENTRDFEKSPNYSFIRADICDKAAVARAVAGADAVVHFAAESHVDRSITDPMPFVESNVRGTCVLLDAALKEGVEKFVHISTDEVYGSIRSGSFREGDALEPNSPYSASKAAAELFARAYFVTHKLPVCVTRSSNNYGPFQFPEKIIPLFATNLLRGKKVPVYGSGMNVRDWLFVEDNCEGIEAVLLRGKPGETYNIGGGEERTNLELTRMLLSEFGFGDEMVDFVPDRKGHDFRYSLDCQKIARELGWTPRVGLGKGLKLTVQWYKENKWWWEPLAQ